MAYIDDIIVKGEDIVSSLTHLREVFRRIRTAGLKLKPSKCELFRREITYVRPFRLRLASHCRRRCSERLRMCYPDSNSQLFVLILVQHVGSNAGRPMRLAGLCFVPVESSIVLHCSALVGVAYGCSNLRFHRNFLCQSNCHVLGNHHCCCNSLAAVLRNHSLGNCCCYCYCSDHFRDNYRCESAVGLVLALFHSP